MKPFISTLSTILFIGISFNIAAYPSKIHCATKEMSDKHKAEIRLRVHYEQENKIINPHAYGSHDSTDPKDKSEADYEDPGSGNTYCYPVQAFNNNLSFVEKLIDFRIDVKHAGDCKNWDLSYQQDSQPSRENPNGFGLVQTRLAVDDYDYDNSTQTYALRHYHFGVHTHCKLRAKTN